MVYATEISLMQIFVPCIWCKSLYAPHYLCWKYCLVDCLLCVRVMADPSGRPACCAQLLDNERQVMIDAVRVLIRCAANILRSPAETKFRRVPLANSKVQQCLLPAYGAIECLFEMGFIESDDHFLLPEAASLGKVKVIHDALVVLSQEFDETPASAVQVQNETKSTVLEDQMVASFWLQKETEFYNTLKRGIAHVAHYTKRELLQKARSCMPLQQLTEKARECCTRMNQGDEFLQDQLLIQLLHWFKESFFHWVNSPSCVVCGSSTKLTGTVPPVSEESAHLAGNVENYCCEAGCVQFTRFPRYNDPGRLLETRCGRCGEWANCFTLLCIAAGLEARYVVDWGDHVWTEVYSTAQRRWLHADPCENICDEPLLYESGWGKKISYIIAYSPDDIQDVTWRYTAHPSDVLSRRMACRETWLVHTIIELRKNIQQGHLMRSTMTSARLTVLAERTAVELVDLMTEKSEVHNLPGRTTGSEEWRRARGELGATMKSHTIIPTETEVESGVVELRYSCVKDEYLRVSDNRTVISGWQSLVSEGESVFRKLEYDWKMVYLARLEGREIGRVAWQFDLGSRNVCISRVEITVRSSCFETGRMHWTLSDSGGRSVDVSEGSRQVFDVFSGSRDLQLAAELTGGSGRMAWQHAQLFRQSLNDLHEHPLVIILHLYHIS